MRFFIMSFAASILMLTPGFAAAQPIPVQALTETNFMITVRAKDGFFIGDDMGGARIMIRDKRTGDLLLEGIASGASTDKLTKDTANLQFSLELGDPLPVTISATGPLSQPQSTATVSKDTVLIPGKDYTDGNGIVLEIPGFSVDILSPPAGTKSKFKAGTPVTLMVNVIDMSGRQIAKDSPIPPEKYQVEARIYKGSSMVAATPLPFSGQPGLYSYNLKMPAAGYYRLIVTAYDPETKEAGMDITGFSLTP